MTPLRSGITARFGDDHCPTFDILFYNTYTEWYDNTCTDTVHR
jgi:hypothetical protein